MSIISGLDRTVVNGDVGNSLLLSSLDDEESFVVLERSTANDISIIGEVGSTHHTQPQIQQNSSRVAFPTRNPDYMVASLGSRISSHNEVQIDPIPIPYDSTNISVSVEEIEKRLQEVLHENINLKENLYQTNLAMKQQLSTVRLLQDRALETQKNHQAKFEETKALIIKLGSEKNELQEKLNQLNEEVNKINEENKELKEANVAFGTETSKLLAENADLKKQLASLQETMESKYEKEKTVSLQLLTENADLKKQLSSLQETLESMSEKEKRVPLQPTAKEEELREVVDQLTRKLETVERARRQQDFDIDKLQAQLARFAQDLTEAQRQLEHREQALTDAQNVQQKSENSLHYGEKLTKYEGLLKQFKSSIQEEQTRFNSLNSWLTLTDPAGNPAQFEISELRRLLAEEQSQSVSRKEKLHQAVATIHELLADFQKLGEEMERVKAAFAVKESHGMAYDEMQKKGFRERLDSLTAKLVEREEALAISERHLLSLQEAVRLQNDEKKETGEVNTLKEQVNNLVGQVTAKDEELEVKNKEVDALKAEVEKLRGQCDTIAVLEEQAKIYQADFEAERRSRASLAAEKERLVEDLRHLQRRNHEIIEELNNTGRDGNFQPTQSSPSSAGPARPRQPERSPSPPPVRKSENLELQINMVFHEKQEGNLCAQHCLNALLQKAHFNAVDLAELAREMDFAEKQTLAEAGVDSQEFQSFISKPSQNMDDSGFFSVQVISCALALWGLEMVPFSSTEPRAVAARSNLNVIKAFICHSNAHWFTIRRIGNRWFNLNSTLEKPKPLSDLYLSLFLIEFEREGNFVFMVFGDLPSCPAEGEEMTENCDDIPSNIVEELENNIDAIKSTVEPKSSHNTLHLVLTQRNTPPTSFSERLRLLLLNRQACNFFGL